MLNVISCIKLTIGLNNIRSNELRQGALVFEVFTKFDSIDKMHDIYIHLN